MAKSTKPKAATKKEGVKPVEETVKVGAMSADPNSEAIEIDMPVSEAIEKGLIEPVPPSVTLSEVKQVEEILTTEQAINNGEAMENIGLIPLIEVEELSNEQKILNYLEDKPKGEIRMNDFLKSLFGVAKFNEPPMWQNQGASKEVRSLLDKINNGDYEVMGNAHLKLGTTYYPDTTTMRAAQHDLNSVVIFIKKVN